MTDLEKYKELWQKYLDKQIEFNKAQIQMSTNSGFLNKQNVDAVFKSGKELQDTLKECMDFAIKAWGMNKPPSN